jgi:hypothetical protein
VSEEVTFEIWQDGIMVASATADRPRAWRDAVHYAAMYGQDGPADIYENVRGKRIEGKP